MNSTTNLNTTDCSIPVRSSIRSSTGHNIPTSEGECNIQNRHRYDCRTGRYRHLGNRLPGWSWNRMPDRMISPPLRSPRGCSTRRVKGSTQPQRLSGIQRVDWFSLLHLWLICLRYPVQFECQRTHTKMPESAGELANSGHFHNFLSSAMSIYLTGLSTRSHNQNAPTKSS